MATADADRPALSVKIDNQIDARPQFGIDRADIVFEELVEGGLTRYVAVWHSDVPARVGPVRSIRPMDPDIAGPLGGIIAYSGGQSRFVAMMKKTELHNAIHGGKDDRFMFRTDKRRAPHNVILQADDVVTNYDSLDAPSAQFRYSPEGWAPLFGRASDGVDIVFSQASERNWRWSADAGVYARSQAGVADRVDDGTRITAENVVVLEVDIDGRYGHIPKTVMVDEGQGWVSTGGSVMKVTWEKTSRDARIVLRNAAGSEVRLTPGNTWVELMPKSGSIDVL
ncbi:DUF3048 domain-containing protein [Microbacterium dauci]|uniref:DUF3048 domain-containing protein n=1 Tax=Microbacterium dauci TaxID=3048008 RepID=A0ABT6ZBS3_9MICO|nr:DUF3048 domain-containing protein [Microbacterium sp. LX3-4]MDJ1113087.1 DUF3048 domain-containing protein [Microbacterium sp. LX3-4]